MHKFCAPPIKFLLIKVSMVLPPPVRWDNIMIPLSRSNLVNWPRNGKKYCSPPLGPYHEINLNLMNLACMGGKLKVSSGRGSGSCLGSSSSSLRTSVQGPASACARYTLNPPAALSLENWELQSSFWQLTVLINSTPKTGKLTKPMSITNSPCMPSGAIQYVPKISSPFLVRTCLASKFSYP